MSTAPIFVTGHPPSRFRLVYFLHDAANGKEAQGIEDLTKSSFPHVRFMSLWLPPFKVYRDQMGLWASNMLPLLMPNTLLVGIGRAGLAAAYLQERFPDLNLSALAINAPTSGPEFTLGLRSNNRVALYSSDYEPIKGLTKNWSDISEFSFDVSWLRHGILSEGGNLCKYSVAYFVAAYMKEPDIRKSCSRVIGDEMYEAFS